MLLDELCGPNTKPEDFARVIKHQRHLMARKVRMLWRYFVMAEMQAFGKNSVFQRAGWNPKQSTAQEDVFPITAKQFQAVYNLSRNAEDPITADGERYL